MLTSTPLPSEQEDFSLVLGGPLYQLWRRLHAAGPALDLVGRRMIGIPLVAWLPLLMMTVYEGVAIGHAVPVPFLYDFEAYVRFLVAIPLFLLAEVVVSGPSWMRASSRPRCFQGSRPRSPVPCA